MQYVPRKAKQYEILHVVTFRLFSSDRKREEMFISVQTKTFIFEVGCTYNGFT